ncbi:hypothetical protein ACHMWU_20285 [Aeromicrobium sp. UC242_57]
MREISRDVPSSSITVRVAVTFLVTAPLAAVAPWSKAGSTTAEVASSAATTSIRVPTTRRIIVGLLTGRPSD